MTLPFAPEFVTQLKGETAWKFSAQLGTVFTPVFFCCDSPNPLGLTDGKEPVAIIDVAPNPAFILNTITLDGSDSYDPDGTVTGYQWTIQGGTPSSSIAPSLTATWSAPGEYEITLIVTDGTGLRSQPARVTMVVQQPEGEYYIASNAGLHYTPDGGVTEVELYTDSAVDSVAVAPSTFDLPAAQRILWIATATGVFASIDGGTNWIDATPPSVPNTWLDSPAPDTANFTWHSIKFGGSAVWVVGRWSNAGGVERSWILYTQTGTQWESLN